MLSSTANPRSTRLWFAAWLVVGASYLTALLGALSIGLFVLPFSLLATLLLARRQGSVVGLPGLISGAGLPVCYVAYLNRSGPGTVCTTSGDGQSCIDQANPWVWFAIGVFLVVVGVAVFIAVPGYGRRGAGTARPPA